MTALNPTTQETDSFLLKIEDSMRGAPITISVTQNSNISSVKQSFCKKMYGYQVPLSLSYRGLQLTPDTALLVNFNIVGPNDVAIIATQTSKSDEMKVFYL